MKTFNITVLICILLITVSASAGQGEGVSLTIYNDNFGVVREKRNLDFNEGVNTLKFDSVASAIDATSVIFSCLSAPGSVEILEQNYEYDLVDTYSLLKRYIDKEIGLTIKGSGGDPKKTTSGILSSFAGKDVIIRNGQSLEIISMDNIEAVNLPSSPDDLVTKPTLVWLAKSDKTESKLCQVAYTTERIGWKADYLATLSGDDRSLKFGGWVTIDNQSGAAYKDAQIKLMAGDVRRVQENYGMPTRAMYKTMALESDIAGGFEEKAFAEYHLYTLGRASTINNNQIKQIEFVKPVDNIPAKKIFIFDRMTNPKKIQVKIEFENKEDFGLGIALPMGKVRVFKKDDADGTLEFIGEDNIDHTAVKEKLSLYIGDAFDIVPEYTKVSSDLGPRSGEYRLRNEKHKVELRNRKNEAVVVFVDEKFSPYMNWQITDKTHEYEKKDANTARFKVEIPADSVVVLEYSTQLKW